MPRYFFFLGTFLPFFAGLGEADRDCLLLAFHLAALSATAAFGGPLLVPSHLALDVRARALRGATLLLCFLCHGFLPFRVRITTDVVKTAGCHPHRPSNPRCLRRLPQYSAANCVGGLGRTSVASAEFWCGASIKGTPRHQSCNIWRRSYAVNPIQRVPGRMRGAVPWNLPAPSKCVATQLSRATDQQDTRSSHQ